MLAERLRNWFGSPPEKSMFTMENSETDFFCLNSDIGLKRLENQDRTAALFVSSGGKSKQFFYCFVLCDGMGGMKNGAIAASISVSTFIESLILNRKEHPKQRLMKSALAANLAVKNSQGGGSTLSAVLISGKEVFSLNVGDSRIYTKSHEGEIKRHTTDDNLKELAGGEDERLLQFVGMGDGLRPHIQELEDDFDFIFLTSDGVHFLDKPVFDKIVQYSLSTTDLCSRLVSTAVRTGGHDNASIIGVSRSVINDLDNGRQSAEIAVWNNKSEMQIIWAERDQKLDAPYQNNETINRSVDDDVQLIESEELNLEGGHGNRKPSSKKQKNKGRSIPKDTFSDFG